MSLTVGELVAYLDVDDSKYNRKLDSAHTKFSSFGGKVGGAVKSIATTGLMIAGSAAAAAGVAAVGATLYQGFGRLTAIEDATAKLTGLGHSAGEVKVVMDNALQSVLGTAFGLGDAATVAASTVAAGVKPGKELESTLKLVADAATIGGASMGEMGQIFNKVAATGKMQGEVIQQLGERGIPIVPLLAKSMGKTAAEVVALASAGKIGFAEFSKAMQAGLGGAAVKSGNTTTGAFKNMMAAVSRLGAGILGPVFPYIKKVFNLVIQGLDAMTAALGPAYKAIGKWASENRSSIMSVLKVIGMIGVATSPMLMIALLLVKYWRPVGAAIANAFQAMRAPAAAAAAYIGKTFAPAGAEMAKTVRYELAAAASFWKQHGNQIKATLSTIAKVYLPLIVAAIKAMLNIVAGAIRVAAALMRGDWGGVWRGLAQIARGASILIVGILRGFGRLAVALLRAAGALMVAALNGAFRLMVSAARAGVSKVISTVRGLPGRAKSAIGSLGSALWSAGVALIQGLIDGVVFRVGALYNKLAEIARAIAGFIHFSHGPLYPVGQKLIGGLMAGIQDQLGPLYAQVGGIAPRLSVNVPQLAYASASTVARGGVPQPAAATAGDTYEFHGCLFAQDFDSVIAEANRRGTGKLVRRALRTSGASA